MQVGVNWVKTTLLVWLHLFFSTVSPSFYRFLNFWSLPYHADSGLSLLLTRVTTHRSWNTHIISSYLSGALTSQQQQQLQTQLTPHTSCSVWTQRRKQEARVSLSAKGASQLGSPAGMHGKRPWEGEGLGSLWSSESETLGISPLWKAFVAIASQEI